MSKSTVFIALILLCFNSACARVVMSPMVDFANSSPDGSMVKNINVTWNGYRLLGMAHPINTCGQGGSQNFNMKSRSDIFGMVHAEWENARGEKVTKDFLFKKEDFPSYKKSLTNIYLFFTQSDVEYYTSDNPNIKKIEREKRGNWVYKWFEKAEETRCVNDPKEVQRLRESRKKYPLISTETGKPINNE